MKRTASATKGYRLAAILAALAAPPLLVLLLASVVFGNDVVPQLVVGHPTSEKPIDLLADLSQTILSLSLGAGAASLWLFQALTKDRKTRQAASLLLPSMALALTSIYAGLRFRFDLAQQLQYTALDFGLVANRLLWQGGCLVLQVSVISAGAVVHFFQSSATGRRT